MTTEANGGSAQAQGGEAAPLAEAAAPPRADVAADGAAAVPIEAADPTPSSVEPSLDDWPVEDDVRLREALEVGASIDLLASKSGEVFSMGRTAEDIRARWRAMLYTPEFSSKAAARLLAHANAHPSQARAWMGAKLKEAFLGARGGTGGGGEGAEGAVVVPHFSEVEKLVVGAPLEKGTPPPPAQLWPSSALRAHGAELVALEEAADRGMMRAAARGAGVGEDGAVAMLCGQDTHYLLRSAEVSVGRNREGSPAVDIDLAKAGDASQVSRQQAVINLKHDGSFQIKNIGRRSVKINGRKLECGKRRRLPPRALVDFGGLSFVFTVDPAAVEKARALV